MTNEENEAKRASQIANAKTTLAEMVRSYRKTALNSEVPTAPAEFAGQINLFEARLAQYNREHSENVERTLPEQIVALLRHTYSDDTKNAKLTRFYAETYLDIKGYGDILYYSFELALDGVTDTPVTQNQITTHLAECRQAILTALEPLLAMGVVSEPEFFGGAGVSLSQMAQLIRFCENDAEFSKHPIFQYQKRADQK